MLPNSGVPFSPISGVPGWLEDAEELKLSSYASYVPPGGVIVEIGSEYGRSAAAFLYGCDPTVKLVSVDLFPSDHPVVGDLRAVFEANLVEAGYATENRVAYRAPSEKVGSLWHEPIDLLFIDGDHTYDGVSKDILLWSKHVKIDGVMLLHDVANGPGAHPLHYEVLKAINEHVDPRDWAMEHSAQSLRAYRRRDGSQDME